MAGDGAGADVIDMTKINSDLAPAQVAVQVARKCLTEARFSRYACSVGEKALRVAATDFYRREYGVTLDADLEVAVVPGTRFGIMALAAATSGPGDVVIVPDPGYPDYVSATHATGADAMTLPLSIEGFQPLWSALAGRAATLLFLNYPSNPCGACAGSGTLEAAVTFAKTSGCWVAHDLAYGPFCYDGRRAASILQCPDASRVAVELWSASKVFGVAGWRVGLVVGNAELVQRVSTLVELHVAAVWPGFQLAVAAALRDGWDEVYERVAIHHRRRDSLIAAISATGTPVVAPEGGMAVWCRAPSGVDAPTLLHDHGLAVVAGEVFGERGAGWLRLALSVPDDRLEEAGRRITAAFGGQTGSA